MIRTLFAALLTLAALHSTPGAETGPTPEIGLKLVAEGLGAPTALLAVPDNSGRMLVAEQAGVIQLLDRDGKKAAAPFLDLREKIVSLGKGMEERGLLGLALHPQFKSNHKFYVVYSASPRSNAPPKWDHAERLSEFKTAGDDFAVADAASERIVLEIDEPDWNHNSGRLAFGPDGYLYWTVGDGGAANDVGDVARGRGHPPEGNGQRLQTLLGKVLRLDVDHGSPYGIPRDNPYADGKTGLPEIFAYGLRNPWGMSFDRGGKHDLIVTDVGQDRWEEINIIVNGGNYGWRLREGFDGFDPKNTLRAPTNSVSLGADGKPFVDPVMVYKTLRGRGTDTNSYGVTITGGYVYRGKALPSLVGKYIFADWSRSMAIPDGTLLVATIPPADSSARRWTAQPLALKDFPNGRIKSYIWALAEDNDGELYVLANGINSVANPRGKVFKLVPE
ncbi:MAG TPA: PQQ-dependent sugar dehydrogenase [Candidatus Saccharimonadales bacterium]|nr:PQQ-dependent sugar dehydrogenase [Candidatus Saccharimonadales bacterium]